jgi:hypothetical protein
VRVAMNLSTPTAPNRRFKLLHFLQMSWASKRRMLSLLTLVVLVTAGLLPTVTEARRSFAELLETEVSPTERLTRVGDTLFGNVSLAAVAGAAEDCSWWARLWGNCPVAEAPIAADAEAEPSSAEEESPSPDAGSSVTNYYVDERVIERVVLAPDDSALRALLVRVGALEAQVAAFEGSHEPARDYSPSSSRRNRARDLVRTETVVVETVSGGTADASFGTLAVTGAATSTFANGIDIGDGCFAVDGVCIAGSGTADGTWSTTSATYYLASHGNIGIGATTSPMHALSVVGTTTASAYALDGRIVISAPGTNNFFVGLNNATGLTSGLNNTFVGRNVGAANTSGTSNTGLGISALTSNTDGGNNVALGLQAMNSNTSGNLNTAAGNFALWSNLTGLSNAGFGLSALVHNTTGSQNAALGSLAGSGDGGGSTANTIGNANTFLGANTGVSVAGSGFSSSTAIGYGALISASNQVVLGGNNVTATLLKGNVGVGTSSPGSLLSVNGVANFTAATSTFYGTGGIDLADGCFAVDGVCISGGGGAADGTWSTTSATYYLASHGNIGVGTSTPGALLAVHGNALVSGTTTVGGLIATGTIRFSNANGAKLLAYDDGGDQYGLGLATGELRLFGGGGGAVNFLTNGYNGTSLLYLDDGGNVGVGTTSPMSPLAVARDQTSPTNIVVSNQSGGAASAGFVALSDAGFVSLASQSSNFNNNAVLGVGGLGDFYVSQNGTPTFFLDSSTGGVGIGSYANALTATPTNGLIVSGSVGIGTSSPSARFAVGGGSFLGGDVRATGTLTVDGDIYGNNIRPLGNILFQSQSNANIYNNSGNGSSLSMAGGGGTDSRLTLASVVSAPFGNYGSTDYINMLVGNGANTATVEAMRIVSGGNVGVGTSSPFAQLSVHARSGATNGVLFAVASSTASATSTHFAVTNAGKVGIGTASPNALLQVGAGSPTYLTGDGALGYFATNMDGSAGVELQNSSLGGTASTQVVLSTLGGSNALSIINYGAGNGGTVFGVGAGSTNLIQANNYLAINAYSNDLMLGAGNAERVRIASTGNVGVGTSSPFAKLSVHGMPGASSNYLFAVATSTHTGTTTPFVVHASGHVSIGDHNDYGFGLYSASGINTDGNMGAANYSLSGQSIIPSSGDDLRFGQGSTYWQSMGLYTNNENRLQIASTGNVGIGTTSPSATLAVQGNSYFAGSVYATGSLTAVGAFGETVSLAPFGGNAYMSLTGAGQLNISLTGGGVSQFGATGDMRFDIDGDANGSGHVFVVNNDAGAHNLLTILDTGNAGFGTTSPFAKLSVHGMPGAPSSVLFAVATSTLTGTSTAFVVNSGGSVGIGDGTSSNWDLHLKRSGTLYAQIESTGGAPQLRLVSAVSSSPSIYFGNQSQNLWEILANGSSSNNLQFYSYGSGTGMTLTHTGLAGIATTTPASALSVQGSILSSALYGGATNVTVDANGNLIRDPSDERLKENIEGLNASSSLAAVLALRGVGFDWRDEDTYGPQREVGFIAQEVAEVIPEAVSGGGEYLSLNTRPIVAVLVEAVKEIWRVVAELAEKVEEISRWFADATTLLVPVGSRVQVEGELCAGAVCVTADELESLLRQVDEEDEPADEEPQPEPQPDPEPVDENGGGEEAPPADGAGEEEPDTEGEGDEAPTEEGGSGDEGAAEGDESGNEPAGDSGGDTGTDGGDSDAGGSDDAGSGDSGDSGDSSGGESSDGDSGSGDGGGSSDGGSAE